MSQEKINQGRRGLLAMITGVSAVAAIAAASKNAEAETRWQKVSGGNLGIAAIGVGVQHYDQGGSCAGVRHLCTREDGTQFWWYASYSNSGGCGA